MILDSKTFKISPADRRESCADEGPRKQRILLALSVILGFGCFTPLARAAESFVDRQGNADFRDRLSHLIKHRVSPPAGCPAQDAEVSIIPGLMTLMRKCVSNRDFESCEKLCAVKVPDTLMFENDLYRAFVDAKLPQVDDLCSPMGKFEVLSAWIDSLNCDRSRHAFGNSTTVRTYFDQIKNTYPFKMKDPKNLCYERAFLLSARLAKDGLASRLIHMTSPSEFRATLDGQPFGFGDHWAVEVKTEDGEKYILDPQFTSEPLNSTTYLRQLSDPPTAPLRELPFMGRITTDDRKMNRTVFQTENPLAHDGWITDHKILSAPLRKIGCTELRETSERWVKTQIGIAE